MTFTLTGSAAVAGVLAIQPTNFAARAAFDALEGAGAPLTALLLAKFTFGLGQGVGAVHYFQMVHITPQYALHVFVRHKNSSHTRFIGGFNETLIESLLVLVRK